MNLSYNLNTKNLTVQISHNVGNRLTHYIYEINISVNNVHYSQNNYTSQPSNSGLTYNYTVNAIIGDSITVIANCIQVGEISRSITVTEDITEGEIKNPVLWPFHAALMLIGFILLMGGMTIAKLRKKIAKWTLKHRIINSVGIISCLSGLIIGIIMVDQTYGTHINTIHPVFGVISICFLIATPLIGQTILWSTKIKKLSERGSLIRTIHRWSGRTTLLLVSVTLILGFLRVFA